MLFFTTNYIPFSLLEYKTKEPNLVKLPIVDGIVPIHLHHLSKQISKQNLHITIPDNLLLTIVKVLI